MTDEKGLVCPRCGSSNLKITFIKNNWRAFLCTECNMVFKSILTSERRNSEKMILEPAVIDYLRALPKGRHYHPNSLCHIIKRDTGIRIQPVTLKSYIAAAGNLERDDHTARTLYKVV